MENLEEMLTDAVKRHSTTEAIQAIVDKQIGDIIARSVENGLRSFGGIGKQIEDKIKAALVLPDLDLPSYGHMVVARMRSCMDEHLNGMLLKVMEDEMRELFEIAPKVLKLADVVEKLKDCARDREDSSNITFGVDDDRGYSSIWMHMDPNDGTAKYECDVRMLVSPIEYRDRNAPPIDYYKDHFKISAIYIDKADATKVQHFGNMDEWKKMLFAAYCCKTPIILGDLDPSLETQEYD